MNKITYILIAIIAIASYQQPSLAKTTNANTNAKQTIKFHKPETDAERALDVYFGLSTVLAPIKHTVV